MTSKCTASVNTLACQGQGKFAGQRPAFYHCAMQPTRFCRFRYGVNFGCALTIISSSHFTFICPRNCVFMLAWGLTSCWHNVLYQHGNINVRLSHSSVTELVNTLFWIRMNYFRCKFVQVVQVPGHETINFGIMRLKVKARQKWVTIITFPEIYYELSDKFWPYLAGTYYVNAHSVTTTRMLQIKVIWGQS